MKMKIVRKQNGKPVAPAVRTAVMTKMHDGRRKLPLIMAKDLPKQDDVTLSLLQCGHVALTWENITPAKAKEMLKHNTTNRTIRESRVLQYMYDLDNDTWAFCTMPIYFYEDGTLADGQHRLTAIVESGKTARMVVGRGLRRPEGLFIDVNLPRDVVDNAHISGLDRNLTRKLNSACRVIEQGDATHNGKSPTESLSLVAKHRAAGQFATTHVRGKKIANGPVYAAVARAWYKLNDSDRLKLERFCEVLRKGQSDGMHESSALTIRRYLVESVANLASSSMWRDTMLRVQHAIKCFIAGRQLLHCSPVKYEAYPL